MTRRINWDFNPQTGNCPTDQTRKIITIKPDCEINDRKYSKPIKIYGPKGETLVNKKKPEKIPFGFVGGGQNEG